MGAWPVPWGGAGRMLRGRPREGGAGPVVNYQPRGGVAVPVGAWPATRGRGRSRGGVAGPVGA